MPFTTARIRLALEKTVDYQLDAISIYLIIFNVLLSTYLVTVAVNIQAMDIAFKSVLMLLLTITGLIGFVAIQGRFPTVDKSLTADEISKILASSVIGLALVSILQILAIRSYQFIYGSVTDVMTQKLLLTNIAIGEEVFFRFFLQSVITKQTGFILPQTEAIFAGSIATSLVFTVYHYVYYGMAGILAAVFLSSIVLCLVYAITRRLSVVMLVHILVNLM